MDHSLEERNTIEMQAVTALAHIKAAVVFLIDISELCDHSISEQVQLFESIKPLFTNKPVFVGLNKTDLVRRSELPQEKNEILEKIESSGIEIVELSTLYQEGIVELRNKVCEICV